jgi:hypothetical protein
MRDVPRSAPQVYSAMPTMPRPYLRGLSAKLCEIITCYANRITVKVHYYIIHLFVNRTYTEKAAPLSPATDLVLAGALSP